MSRVQLVAADFSPLAAITQHQLADEIVDLWSFFYGLNQKVENSWKRV